MTYGCQTRSLAKQLANKPRTTKRAMERNVLNIKLQDELPCSDTRKRPKMTDIAKYILQQRQTNKQQQQQ